MWLDILSSLLRRTPQPLLEVSLSTLCTSTIAFGHRLRILTNLTHLSSPHYSTSSPLPFSALYLTRLVFFLSTAVIPDCSSSLRSSLLTSRRSNGVDSSPVSCLLRSSSTPSWAQTSARTSCRELDGDGDVRLSPLCIGSHANPYLNRRYVCHSRPCGPPSPHCHPSLG